MGRLKQDFSTIFNLTLACKAVVISNHESSIILTYWFNDFGSGMPGSAGFSFLTECLKDCDDVPAGQRAPCRADCFRSSRFSVTSECLKDCEDLPAGQRAACKADCFRSSRYSLTSECLKDCEDLPAGQKAPC